MRDFLRGVAERRGDSPFLTYRDRSVSFGRMDERSNQAANLLREIGVRRGDKACLIVSDRPEFLELWFGLAKLGAITVPLEPSLGEEDVTCIVTHSDATLLAAEGAFSPAIGEAVRTLPRIRKKVWIGDDGRTPPGFLNYGAAVDSLPRTLHRPPATDPSDVLAIAYTPGTTGIPKGVMLSLRNCLRAARDWAGAGLCAAPDDVFVATLPLSRIFTQTLTVLCAMAAGSRLVLPGRFNPAAFLAELRRAGGTLFGVTAGMLAALLATPPREDDRENPGRLAFGGPLPAALRRDFAARFDIGVVEGYGMAECAGMCLARFGEDARDGSIGKPLPGYDVKVVDEYGEELPTGISGEIVLRPEGPEGIFLGYYREHDRTAENMRNGWFHTGDRGYVDTEGDFSFLDRTADGIRQGGEIFSSLDVDRVVDAHPKVLESAATGVLSELVDEVVRVFVVPRPGVSVSPEEIIGWCAGKIAPCLIPRYVEVVPDLPKTSVGGIRKHVLRKRRLADFAQAGE